MIALEIFGETDVMRAVAERVQSLDGVSRVRVAPALGEAELLVFADVRHDATDRLVRELGALGVASEAIRLSRVEEIGYDGASAGAASLIWADVVGLAGSNARLIGRYLAFMAVAGVIACYGVVEADVILIVGAMAVSPDLLPITATAVGIVGGSWKLALRALLTLLVGLATASIFAALFALMQDQLSLLPSAFHVGSTVLQSLVTVNDETVAVALAAGVAGMLAFETRASAGVGVAISVTTIPAAAYLGVAAGVGEFDRALGALGVLGTNVVMITAGAAATLAAQRALKRDDPSLS